MPDNNYLNHGGYMLLSNSYLFSSTVEEENCIESGKMTLKESDVVHVRVITGKNVNKIEFKEEGTGRKEHLTFDWRDDMSYHFGVYLYEEGDSVEILNSRI
jgi:hypothetical protein